VFYMGDLNRCGSYSYLARDFGRLAGKWLSDPQESAHDGGRMLANRN